jgi:hypothetical protein
MTTPSGWRATPVAELDLPATVARRLRRRGLATLGPVVDAGGRAGGLVVAAGLTPDQVEDVESALDRWWGRRMVPRDGDVTP